MLLRRQVALLAQLLSPLLRGEPDVAEGLDAIGSSSVRVFRPPIVTASRDLHLSGTFARKR